MSDLAYDANGNPIRPLPEARKWLLKKVRPKAPPQVVFRNGQRVTLPINAGVQHLRQVVNEPGRYRLVALDELDDPIEGMAEAYVELDAEPSAAFVAPAPPDPLHTTRAALAGSPMELLLLETVRANTELARTSIERIPDILRSSAYLLQTADGAGLPRRPPMRIEDFDDDEDDDDDDDDDYDDEHAPAPPSLLDTFFRSAMNSGGLGGLAKLLGGGTTGGTTTTMQNVSTAAADAPEIASTTPTAPRNAAQAQPVDPQAHLLSILAQLTADERGYAERVFAQLSPEAVRQWHELLLSMSIDDAVKMIRAKAAGQEA